MQNEVWRNAAGTIRIVVEPDVDYTFEDYEGDMYNPAANPDIYPEKLAESREVDQKAFYEAGGTMVATSQYLCPCCKQFVDADSIGGMYGYDYDDEATFFEGYFYDLTESARAALTDCLTKQRG